MKIISKMLKVAAVFLLVVGIQSCSNDDDNNIVDPGPQNIVEIAVATPSLNNLVAALQAADGDLVSVLSGPGPFTVLAPTNEAFATFLSDNGFSSLDDVPTDVLSQILLNHVIADDVLSSDLISAGSGYASTSATGVGGRNLSIYFNTTSGVRFNDAGSVTSADIDASNGTIHIVDGVIGLPTIVDHAAANPSFSQLVGALSSAPGDLVNVLNSTMNLTVLAPINEAFADLPSVPTGDVLAQVLLNHVLDANVFSSDLIDAGAGYSNTSAIGPNGNNLSLYYNTSDGVTFNGTSDVAVADVVATNGVIHAVDAVILPPSIVDFALADPNFSTLVSALTDLTPGTDFVATLSTPNGTDPAPFTVFAPTNDAFAALPEIPGEAVLTQVLLHHVLGNANVRSADLTNGVSPVMLNSQAITINLPGTGGNIADVTDAAGNDDIGIIGVDVQATNGVIHVLNKVMLPGN